MLTTVDRGTLALWSTYVGVGSNPTPDNFLINSQKYKNIAIISTYYPVLFSHIFMFLETDATPR